MIPVFSPLTGLAGMVRSLFSAGEQGVWYDPSDLSTMYQDAAGTTPVTGVEQPVGKILDKSGRGNHATQATTTSRPTLKQDASGKYYLSFDGVDDYLSTGSIDFTATDKMTVFAGVRKLSDAVNGIVVELSANRYANAGAISLHAPAGGGNQYLFGSRGTVDGAWARVSPGTYPTPQTAVLTGIGNISGDKSLLRVNGSTAATEGAFDQGSGNYGNFPLYIGRRGGTSYPFNGCLYGMIVRGAATDDDHLTHAEKYLAYKSGVTL